MPTNLTRRKRYREPDVPESFIEFLKTGRKPTVDLDFWLDRQYFCDHGDTRDIWEELRSDLMREWKRTHPDGSLPWAAQQFDKPKERSM